MAISGESLLWFFHVDGGFFSQRAFLQIWDDLFFFWTMGRNQRRKTKPGWNSGCSCELLQFPLNSEGFRLLSSGIRSLSQVHSGFHDPKQQFLFLFLRESIPWSDILRNLTFMHLPYFPLLSHLSVPFPVAHVFIIEEGSWAPLKKAEIFWVSAGVIWNALGAFLHPSSQFRNVLVLCKRVCHICQLHMVVWNILKHLKHCWIPTCDGCTKLWSSLSKQTSFNQGHPGVSLYSRSWILSEMSCQAHCDVKENSSLL